MYTAAAAPSDFRPLWLFWIVRRPFGYAFACRWWRSVGLGSSVPEQVDGAGDDDHADESKRNLKRKAVDGAHKLGLDARQYSELMWTQRYTGGAREGWRSAPLHRVSARRWLLNIDAQLRQCTHLGGLGHFVPGDGPAWANWRDWPHITICCDLGSDGLSAYMALERKWKVSCDLLGDMSHSANRDVINSLKSCSLFSFWLCMLISWNVPFGPHRDDIRYEELRSMLRDTLSSTTPATNVLFGTMVGRLAECYRQLGHTFAEDRPLDLQVWEKLHERMWFTKEGYRGQSRVRGAKRQEWSEPCISSGARPPPTTTCVVRLSYMRRSPMARLRPGISAHCHSRRPPHARICARAERAPSPGLAYPTLPHHSSGPHPGAWDLERHAGNLCRFQSLSAMALKHCPHWAIDEFERTTVGLRQDYLKGAGFMQRLQMRADAMEVHLEGSTDNQRVSLEDKALRSVCQNAVAVSVVMLSDEHHRRTCVAISGLMKPLLTWHIEQIKVLRSSPGKEEYYTNVVVNGAFFDHINETIRQLTDTDFLNSAGLLSDFAAMASLSQEDVGLEDDMATTCGEFAFVLVGARCKRALLLQGVWPQKMLGILGTPGQAAQVIADFQRDLQVWRDFEQSPNKDSKLLLLQRRSCFQKTSVSQLIQAMEDPEAPLGFPHGFVFLWFGAWRATIRATGGETGPVRTSLANRYLSRGWHVVGLRARGSPLR